MKLKHGMVVVKPEGNLVMGYYLTHGGVSVWNPYVSSCGRFKVDPTEEYGITAEEAETLKELNKEHFNE